MFARILIANRGEIACRIIETCHRLGVSTVAVYSDADVGARHVALADRAVRIGPPSAAESYLDGAAIIASALATGAEAIHPGYGFLSENPDFVEMVEAAGLVFVGPPASAIRAMGLKDNAKALMSAAGVPVVPGYHGPEQDAAFLADRAREIGFPVMIKAVAGGGGKGMRRVDTPGIFAAALAAARGEAQAAFGNSAVLIEKWVAVPRHIEIQIFADRHGSFVHLFERDCSLQRRHQKVIEEAPAPGMSPELRATMGEAAVTAAAAIDYVGAGTVEFIVDGARGLVPGAFWFMEMNTRLQVEHPVTEAITGEDLVEWQLRVAAGDPLPKTQEELAINGHAVEARVYAEDPARGFLPAIGTLTALSFPPDVRVDSGVRAGDAITPYYDPMIAKVVAHGPTRAGAIRRLVRALAATRVAGCTTNLGFLARLARQPEFVSGELDTGVVDRHLDALSAAPARKLESTIAAALCSTDLIGRNVALAGFTLWAPLVRDVALDSIDGRLHLSLAVLGPDRYLVDAREVVVVSGQESELSLTVDGKPWRFGIARSGRTVTVFDGAESSVFELVDPLDSAGASHHAADEIVAPMPGLVKRLAARPGAAVTKGELLLVLEAMKMEHALVAPRDGTVATVAVADGQQVTDGAILLSLDPQDD